MGWVRNGGAVLLTALWSVGCGDGGAVDAVSPVVLEMRVADTVGAAEHASVQLEPGGDVVFLSSEAALTNAGVRDARVVVYDGMPQILLSLTDSAAHHFAEVTGASIGKRMAILLDGEIVRAPVIRTRIDGGKAMITGVADRARAEQIARALRSHR